MVAVKKSNLGLIKTVFNSNTDNEQFYGIINSVFNGKVDYLEFSKPIIQTSAGYILWKSNTPGPYLQYSELKDSKQKLYLNQMVQKAISEIREKLDSFKQDEDFLNKIIEIPSEKSIFYTENEGKISIILTEWGFTKDEFVKSQGILKKVFPLGLQSFILKFKSKKGEFLEGINCHVKTYNSTFQGSSDKRGYVSLNDLEKGQDILVSSIDNNFKEVKITIEDNEDYTIIVNRIINLSFVVLNSNDIPVENTNFYFVSKTLGKEEFTTNGFGEFNLNHIENDDIFKVFDTKNNLLHSEEIQNKDSKYTIRYDTSNEETIEEPIKEEIIEDVDNDILIDEDAREDNKIIIELLNWRKKPIKNHSLNFYGTNKGKESFVTNDEGQFYFNNLEADKEYSIFMKFKKSDWKKDFVHKKDNKKYSFVVKNKKILWWWIPFFFLFFFLLSLISTEVQHDYTVLDSRTKDPIENALISSSIPSVYQTNSFGGMTNNKGKVDIKYSKLPIYKQIFYKPSTTINVTKNGYENLNTEVSLAFFKTNKSEIYLNSLRRDTVVIVKPNPEIIQIPCENGELHDESGDKELRVDLGKKNSTFLFEYFNENQIDTIKVYSDDRSLLFKCNWSTRTTDFQDSIELTCPSRYVIVTVEGNSNWGIHVNCP